MTTDSCFEKEEDTCALWIKETHPSGVLRFRRWMLPALAVVVLVLIIALAASNAKTSNRLWTAEQHVSNLSDIIQSLNASLQHVRESVSEVQWLQAAVENNKDQLSSVSEALKQLSAVDSLTRSVALLKCSLESIINNSSAAADNCCPLGWTSFGKNCYFFSRSSLTWNESRAWCDRQDAHLVILLSDQDWEFVTRHTRPVLFWVGLSDWRTGKWEWVNQTPYKMERRRWVPGQPDNWTGHGLGAGDEDCAHLHRNGGLNDLHCSSRLRYICQKHSQHN